MHSYLNFGLFICACFSDIYTARLMVYNAARLKEANLPFLQEASMAKLYASQVTDLISKLCYTVASSSCIHVD